MKGQADLLKRVRWTLKINNYRLATMRCPDCGEQLELAGATRKDGDCQGGMTYGILLLYQCVDCKKPKWGIIIPGEPERTDKVMGEVAKLCCEAWKERAEQKVMYGI